MSDHLGIAVIGSGYWGVNYVRIFGELPDARLVVVCDQREERLREIGRRFPGVALSTSMDEALAMEGVDAAVVCTPATTHYPVATRCLDLGKHVLIEKPITGEVGEAEELTALARARGLVLMVGHTFLYHAAVRKMKELTDLGDLGRIYYLYARRTNLGPIRHDVNALWDLAPHDVSIFNFLLDSSPRWVSAVGVNLLRNGREDVGFISLGYPGNVVAHIHVSWADPHKVREIVVVGSNRRVVFNEFNPVEMVRVFEKGITFVEPEPATYGEHQLLMRDGDIVSPRIEASEPLKNQCVHFIECVKHGIPPLTDGRAGTEVVRVMEAIDQSVALNGAPVQIERVGQAGQVQQEGETLWVSPKQLNAYRSLT